MAEEEAATEGLALVKCYGNTTGYKQVTQKGPGCFYALVYHAQRKNRKKETDTRALRHAGGCCTCGGPRSGVGA